MNSSQQEAFDAGSGLHAQSLNVEIRLLVGGVALIVAVLILGGLMHLLNSSSPWDKMLFVLSMSALSFVLMLVFIYIA